MQPMQLFFRQSLRTSLHISKNSRPVRSRILPAASPTPLRHPGDAQRNFSACLRCQFRTQNRLFAHENEKSAVEKGGEKLRNDEPSAAVPEGAREVETDAGSQGSPRAADDVHTKEQEGEEKTNFDSTGSGGLPSYIEGRRSQFSKQFTTMMDNLQSNVFVAGQRLNDLTGYSSIEALKRSIHEQEERLRAARLKVRSAKDDYAAAINRRSASQREVNELLQRKHAWSPADLERFTHLYRNDHANEVAESETQEALSAAEREAEEAAAQLTRQILSRYHEEQVWSDKIRRMSTWGTWGLMGVNVLLFLIFQIAVEPWRRKRLVRGFEEKVIEAMEKEKVSTQNQTLTPDASLSPVTEEVITELPEGSLSTGEITADEAAAATAASATPITDTEDAPTEGRVNGALESYRPPPLEFPPSPSTVETWRQYLHDLFSDRSIIVTQRDLSTVAVTSAAAGAAVMGLIIALIRPR